MADTTITNLKQTTLTRPGVLYIRYCRPIGIQWVSGEVIFGGRLKPLLSLIIPHPNPTNRALYNANSTCHGTPPHKMHNTQRSVSNKFNYAKLVEHDRLQTVDEHRFIEDIM